MSYAHYATVLFFLSPSMLALFIIILYYARWQHKNEKTQQYKMKNKHKDRRKIKRKTTKSTRIR